jgi:hypothetical protein
MASEDIKVARGNTDGTRRNLHDTRRYCETRLAVMKLRTSCELRSSSDRVERPKPEAPASWVVLHRNFEGAADDIKWTSCDKAAPVLATSREQAADVLCSTAANAKFKSIVGA